MNRLIRRPIPSLLTSLFAAASLAVVGAACGEETSDGGGGGGGGGAFVGANFSFSVVAAKDDCNDGALEVLFLPDGPETPNAFDDPIYVPAESELPWTGEVKLPEPFVKVDATITGDAATRVITGADNTDVALDEETYPGCKVDFETSVTINVEDPDRVTGPALLSMTNLRGAACPTVTSDPCTITIDLVGTR